MENKSILHYPRLDTVLMVEDTLRKAEEYPSKRQLWLALEKKVKGRLEKDIKKIIEYPEIGKPISYAFNGDRTARIPPFRLIYAIKGNSLILLRFEHRGDVYG